MVGVTSETFIYDGSSSTLMVNPEVYFRAETLGCTTTRKCVIVFVLHSLVCDFTRQNDVPLECWMLLLGVAHNFVAWKTSQTRFEQTCREFDIICRMHTSFNIQFLGLMA